MICFLGFPGGNKNPSLNAVDIKVEGSILGSGRSFKGGHRNPPQYSWLENPMDREAWKATVHEVTKSQIRLKQLSTHAHIGCLQETHFSTKDTHRFKVKEWVMVFQANKRRNGHPCLPAKKYHLDMFPVGWPTNSDENITRSIPYTSTALMNSPSFSELWPSEKTVTPNPNTGCQDIMVRESSQISPKHSGCNQVSLI